MFRNSYDVGNNVSHTMREKAAAHFKEAFFFKDKVTLKPLNKCLR